MRIKITPTNHNLTFVIEVSIPDEVTSDVKEGILSSGKTRQSTTPTGHKMSPPRVLAHEDLSLALHFFCHPLSDFYSPQ